MMKKHQCLECAKPLDELVYAFYKQGKSSDENENEEIIAGYLCDHCRKKHKVKSLRPKQDHLKKLAQLKEQLSQNQL